MFVLILDFIRMNVVLVNKDNFVKCAFCGNCEVNPVKLGDKYQLGDLVVHYLCVLLSSYTFQNGEDHEGIKGFLYDDLQTVLKRVKLRYCVYCELSGAATHCYECEIDFHVPCGLENGAISIFKNDFRTYCEKHRPKQNVPVEVMSEATVHTPTCVVCLEIVSVEENFATIWAPCCRKTWYHRCCLQEMAFNEASLFKCAVCKNRGKFRYWMVKNGIYVPQRDASWETDPFAYDELNERYCRCDVSHCASPYGRNADRPGTMWEILVCQTCGSQGTHVRCSNLKFRSVHWECPECIEITTKNNHIHGIKRLKRTEHDKNATSDSESEIHVISSDSEINVISTSGSDVDVA